MHIVRRIRAIGMTLMLVLGSPAIAQDVDLVITDARIVSPPLAIVEKATIVIDDGRIVDITSGPVAVTAERYIDARGRTVIPGMIDTHVHFSLSGIESPERYQAWADTEARAKLRDYATHGFTTILSTGDYWPAIQQVRDQANESAASAPRVLISGPILTPKNGHGAIDFPHCLATAYCTKQGFFREVDDVTSARAIIRELAAAGVDGIKIAHDGNPIAYPTDKPMGRFRPGVLRALIDEAHRHKLPVRVHSYPVAFAREAVELGADALVHGPGLIRVGGQDDGLPALLDLLALKKVGVSTTLGAQTYLEDAWGVARDVPFGQTDLVEYLKASPSGMASLHDAQLFQRSGVRLAFGTDIINLKWPRDAIRLEMRLLSEAGFDNATILRMATADAAAFLGLSHEIGSIEKGKAADLVLLSADPLATIEAFARIDFVVRRGTVIHEFGK